MILPLVLAAALSTAADVQKFGAALEGLAPVELADVLAKPQDGQRIRLEGEIRSVCRNKGCWLELAQGEQGIHVTFKDYAFFVPKDAAGRTVVAEGIVQVKKPSASDLAHLEGEGAKKAGAGVSFEASGVEIR